MNFTETEWLLQKAQQEELLQNAAGERSVRQACLTQSNRKAQSNKTVAGLVSLFMRLGCWLLPACCSRHGANLICSVAIYPIKEPGDARLCC